MKVEQLQCGNLKPGQIVCPEMKNIHIFMDLGLTVFNYVSGHFGGVRLQTSMHV